MSDGGAEGAVERKNAKRVKSPYALKLTIT